MSALSQVEEASRFIHERVPLHPHIGVILGTGLGGWARNLTQTTALRYSDIPHFSTPTVAGHEGRLVIGVSAGVTVAALAGRFHLYEGFSPQHIVLPVRTLARLGVRILIVTNAAGAVNVNFRPGELVIIEDHINFTGQNPLVGAQNDGLGRRFPDMSEAYDRGLREIAEKACWKSGVPVRKGVYMAFVGPSFETPAEIRMARSLGADVVGMSTVFEVIAARQLGLRVLGLAGVSNMAAGVVAARIAHAEVVQTSEKLLGALADALELMLPAIARQLPER